MKLSVYLHEEYIFVLKTFGDLSTVSNKILDYCYSNDIDIQSIPNAIPRDGAKRTEIEVTNEEYLEDYGMSPNSPRFSLRKILYWFVDNSIYEELGWKQVNTFVDKKLKSIKKHLRNILDEIGRLQFELYDEDVELLREARKIIKSLEARYESERNEHDNFDTV